MDNDKEPRGNKFYDDLLERHGDLLRRFCAQEVKLKERKAEIRRLRKELNDVEAYYTGGDIERD